MSGNEDFNDWLQAYADAWDRPGREAIEAAVWKDYGMEGAVLVLDMTGFSRLTAQFGALHYLSMVRRMQVAAKAIIRRTRGELVKFEADNCFARFKTVDDALQAGLLLHTHFSMLNRETSDEYDIHISIGIDWGWYLLVDETDFYGNPVNRASKLGEDMAKADQILMTNDAFEKGVDLPSDIKAEMAKADVAGSSIDIRVIDLQQ